MTVNVDELLTLILVVVCCGSLGFYIGRRW